MIEKRNALSETAKRAGWVGCNLLINEIPELGKIYYIQNKKIVEKSEVIKKWEKTIALRVGNVESRGWIFEVLKCIDKTGKQEFALEDIYFFTRYLQIKYPENNSVQAKIRQQFQILRDKELIEFLGRGYFRRVI